MWKRSTAGAYGPVHGEFVRTERNGAVRPWKRPCQVPLRTKRTADHSEGSPGVMATKTPSRRAWRRLELYTND